MGYLILAVIFQVLMSLWLKWGETRNQHRMMLMTVNYAVATFISGVLWWAQGAPVPEPVTWWLGLLGGITYTLSLLLWMIAIAGSGLGIATSSMRLSVVWPTLVSMLVFSEIPNLAQMTGVALAFVVLGLLATHAIRRHVGSIGGGELVPLLLLFCFHGGVGLTQKMFTEYGHVEQRMGLLMIIFGVSLVLTAGVVVWQRAPLSGGDLLRGGVFGGGNILTNFMLLKGLARVPGVIAFPFSNVSVIVLASLAGWLIWKEQMGRTGLMVVGLSAIAIALMTLDY